ncbi:MAG TPA: LuxR C-terminal-related transcriptional regulator [Phycisphaerales bacterium]|nr:LuxR C-terminal-related transcriptional regulator [Phycisphaerales bacterium]
MVPGTGVVVRDRNWKVVWCNDMFARQFGGSPESMKGTSIYDILPADAAEERVQFMRQSVEQRVRVQYISMWCGKRSSTTILPLDPASFGHEGVLVVLAPALCPDEGRDLPVCGTPVLGGGLERLSKAELCIAYLFARGLTPTEIGVRLSRSEHTINDHIKAIHRKLGVSRAPELATILAHSGIAAFTEAEWCGLSGATIPNASHAYETKPVGTTVAR